ncbi:MAG TPA: hypothetical protein VE398_15920, partial [Acidobacteriota bacterium]|nr:hypothetical protein [Acidobacteriota bacterium]
FGSAFSIGFDGTNGWSQSDQGIRELDGAHLSRLKQEADFSSSLNLREKYQNLRVIGKLPVGDHQAYVVQGNLSADKRLERLFFDTESGLLLRIFFRETTPLGPLPEETDFDDYRDVNGIKLPFSVLHLGSDRSYKDVCSEILQNTPVDDARFGRPVDSPK